jgi:hypothetical protein
MTGVIAAAARYIIKGVLKNDPAIGKYFPIGQRSSKACAVLSRPREV